MQMASILREGDGYRAYVHVGAPARSTGIGIRNRSDQDCTGYRDDAPPKAGIARVPA